MRICVVGSGVIGTIYGSVLSKAGHDITHYVRDIASTPLAGGVDIRLLDGRDPIGAEVTVPYCPRLAERINPGYDLILASVRHYQVDGLLPVLASAGGGADVLFFNNWWRTFDAIDQLPDRGRYLWGFPVAGGGWDGNRLEAALLGEVRLGEVDGRSTDRVRRIASLFQGCDLSVDQPADIGAWLWVHFAIEAGVIGSVIAVGDAEEFLDSVDHLQRAVFAVRESLAVVQARGVDIDASSDAQMFFAPAEMVAEGIRAEYQVNRPARKIMKCHTGAEELRRIYHDVLDTGRQLGVTMPHLEALGGAVDAWRAPIPARDRAG